MFRKTFLIAIVIGSGSAWAQPEAKIVCQGPGFEVNATITSDKVLNGIVEYYYHHGTAEKSDWGMKTADKPRPYRKKQYNDFVLDGGGAWTDLLTPVGKLDAIVKAPVSELSAPGGYKKFAFRAFLVNGDADSNPSEIYIPMDCGYDFGF